MKNINDTEDVDETSNEKFHTPHDKIVKLGFSNITIAQGFLADNLPTAIKKVINLKTLRPIKTSFIDKHLKETFCDMAFDCLFKDKGKNKGIDKSIDRMKLVILVEHQSTPDRLMPFRVTHYLNSLSYNELNARQNNKQAKLSPVYALVFYHGKQKHYPYSRNLRDCYNNPNNIMESYFAHQINLINVHDYDDDELIQQKLHGIMSYALKHSRDNDLLEVITKLIHVISTIDYQSKDELQFTQQLLEYLFNFKSIKQPEKLVKHVSKLPTPIRGEVMTIAEQLATIMFKDKVEQQVKEEVTQQIKDQYAEQAVIQTAIKALEKNADVNFIAEITNLSIEKVLTIKAEHNL